MRLAWFTPLPPVRSGVAACSDDRLTRLDRDHRIDRYVDRRAGRQHGFDAHDLVWRQRREPYDLVVYQLGNAPCHDYMWAYLTAYPALPCCTTHVSTTPAPDRC